MNHDNTDNDAVLFSVIRWAVDVMHNTHRCPFHEIAGRRTKNLYCRVARRLLTAYFLLKSPRPQLHRPANAIAEKCSNKSCILNVCIFLLPTGNHVVFEPAVVARVCECQTDETLLPSHLKYSDESGISFNYINVK
jgi:hypothetical protein